MSGKVEDAQSKQGQWRAGKPQQCSVGFQATDALKEKHRALKQAGLLEARFAPPRWRMQSSCHEKKAKLQFGQSCDRPSHTHKLLTSEHLMSRRCYQIADCRSWTGR